MDFNGSNTGVSVPDSASLDVTTGLSLIGWIGWSTTSGDKYAIEKAPDLYDFLILSGSHGKMGFYLSTSSGGFYLQTVGSSYNDGVVRCFNCTYDSTLGSNQMKIYVDGVLEAQQDATGTINTSTANLGIGKPGTANAFYWNGAIQEVMIYNRALSVEEIKSIYESPSNDNITTGRVGHWRFDEKPDGTNASGAGSIIDISGNGNHGSPVNTPVHRAFARRTKK